MSSAKWRSLCLGLNVLFLISYLHSLFRIKLRLFMYKHTGSAHPGRYCPGTFGPAGVSHDPRDVIGHLVHHESAIQKVVSNDRLDLYRLLEKFYQNNPNHILFTLNTFTNATRGLKKLCV